MKRFFLLFAAFVIMICLYSCTGKEGANSTVGNTSSLSDRSPVSEDSVELFSMPLRTAYFVGEPLDVSGCFLKVVQNGILKYVEINKSMVSGFDSETLGTKNIVIEYNMNGKVYNIDFTVRVVNDLSLKYNTVSKTVRSGNLPDLDEGWNLFNYSFGDVVESVAVFIPADYDTDVRYPVQMYLHGDGELGWTAKQVIEGDCAVSVRRAIKEIHDTIIIVPTAKSSWLLVPNDVARVYPYHSYSMADAYESIHLQAAEKLFDEVCEKYSADPSRLYLSGYSRGTMASWFLLYRDIDRYAGALLCCGAGDPDVVENFQNTPVWLFTGQVDELVSTKDLKSLFNRYSEFGDGRYTEYTAHGHGFSDMLETERNLISWLYSKVNTVKCSHAFGEESVSKSPTCTEYGLNIKKCTRCGRIAMIPCKSVPHIFENGICTLCGTSEESYDAYVFGTGGKNAWKIDTNDEGNIRFTAKTNEGALIIPSLCFNTGTIEWDMTVKSEDYKYNGAIGIIWASEGDLIDIYKSNYYVTGRFKGGIFVTFAKFNGSRDSNAAFAWENAKQISNGSTMAKDKKVHYKLKYDGTHITIEVGGESVTIIPGHKLFGSYVGIYSESVGTVFENIIIRDN